MTRDVEIYNNTIMNMRIARNKGKQLEIITYFLYELTKQYDYGVEFARLACFAIFFITEI